MRHQEETWRKGL